MIKFRDDLSPSDRDDVREAFGLYLAQIENLGSVRLCGLSEYPSGRSYFLLGSRCATGPLAKFEILALGVGGRGEADRLVAKCRSEGGLCREFARARNSNRLVASATEWRFTPSHQWGRA